MNKRVANAFRGKEINYEIDIDEIDMDVYGGNGSFDREQMKSAIVEQMEKIVRTNVNSKINNRSVTNLQKNVDKLEFSLASGEGPKKAGMQIADRIGEMINNDMK